jgi:hypothetical protein
VREVKELCELALQASGPPLRDSGAVLAELRRSARRRARLTSVGAGLAVLAGVAAGTAAFLPGGGPTATLGRSAPRVDEYTPPDSYRVAEAHGSKVARILVDAVPPGYTTKLRGQPGIGGHVCPHPDVPPATDPDLVDPGRPTCTDYSSDATVMMAAGGGEGMLTSRLIRATLPEPGDDLCSGRVPAPFNESWSIHGLETDEKAACEQIVVAGVPIQVITGKRYGIEIKMATRFLNGGTLTVVAYQEDVDTRRFFEKQIDPRKPAPPRPKPRLAEQPFTSRQLAEIAADRGVLP